MWVIYDMTWMWVIHDIHSWVIYEMIAWIFRYDITHLCVTRADYLTLDADTHELSSRIAHVYPQKWPIFSGSFVENDLDADTHELSSRAGHASFRCDMILSLVNHVDYLMQLHWTNAVIWDMTPSSMTWLIRVWLALTIRRSYTKLTALT